MINLPNRLLFFLLFFIGHAPLFSQEAKTIKLFVYKDNKAIEKFGVANITTKEEGKYIDGYHVINASVGDELFIASDDFKNFYKLVTTEDTVEGKIEIYTKDGIIQLEEVVLTEKKLSYGTFTEYAPKIYTPAERQLRTASKVFGGGGIGFDPVINLISGRTKKLKKRLKAETKNNIVEFLEDNYKDYILNDLELPREQLGLFCYFVSDKNKGIHKISERKRVEFLLKRLYLEFVKDPADD
ncbi:MULTISPECIES: hypothetical protein [Galbibacter]|uniref:DUF4369 domain-containing protein n=1 Tax=Galbibacter pacificus TaxID=2996052 RepID=A0ABT6FRL1_9FLAO|nr:hypothetical protein [Galbibacter pacificus]MDG3582978.1 hypothetical protein [Galbibacter pacificus]MDG3585903.1 hypothetical protein [Galbibacter pacificus]